MTLRLAEGFETFGTTVGNTIQTGLNRRYSEFHDLSLSNYGASIQLATGRNGGYSAKACNSNYQYFFHVVAADDVPTNDTWIIGVAVRFDSTFPSSNTLIVLRPYQPVDQLLEFRHKIARYGSGGRLWRRQYAAGHDRQACVRFEPMALLRG